MSENQPAAENLMETSREKFEETSLSPAESVGPMHKRKVLMEDGRRHLIYYTFGDNEEQSTNEKASEK